MVVVRSSRNFSARPIGLNRARSKNSADLYLPAISGLVNSQILLFQLLDVPRTQTNLGFQFNDRVDGRASSSLRIASGGQFSEERRFDDAVDLPEQVIVWHEGFQINDRPGLGLKDMQSLHERPHGGKQGNSGTKRTCPYRQTAGTIKVNQLLPPSGHLDFFNTPDRFRLRASAVR